ncbi:hypothetical protein, partial [Vulcanococcus limneticus]|uniref:hypothetical protein n=1 Tax=Vulcanococcus limneticus TaxID=2170428 RepID=UPI001E595E6D
NVRYSILLLCRLFGGFFMSSEPLRFADYSRCPNVIHEQAPNSKICFNTNPSDTLEALQRWI